NLSISIVAETSMCSLPTMKFNGAPGPGCGEAACEAEVVSVLWRSGPLSFSLCTYRVRIMKNCPLEFTISFKTLRAAAGVALKLRSIMFRCSDVGGGVLVLVAVAIRPTAGDGVGVEKDLRSSGNGARCKEVTPSTLASSRMF